VVIFLIGFTFIPDTFGITVPVNIPMGAALVKNYEPSTVKIEIGDTIKWTVFDKGNNVRHTVTSDLGLFDSGSMTRPPPPAQPPTFTLTFNEGGIYNYHCKIHSWMTGSVIVNESTSKASVKDCSNLGCVYLDKERFGVSEGRTVLVKIYGELNDGGGWAHMTVKDPTGTRTQQRVMVTSSGYFENPMSISYDKRGVYTVIVTRGDYNPNGTHVGTVTFEVVKISASQQKDVTPTSMILSTDLQRYEKGAIIGIAGQLIPYQRGTTDVTIMIRSQNGNVVEIAQVPPSSTGTFSKTFNTLSWSSAGNYEVQAKYENLIKSATFYFSIPSSSTSKTSTFLKLDSLDNTFTAKGPNSGADVTYSGELLTGDRKSNITNAEIKLVFTGFTFEGKGHYKMTTDGDGEYELTVLMPIGVGYGVQAVYDGSLSSKFKSSKSQTESFTVMSATSPVIPPTSPVIPPTQSSGGSDLNFMWILIILVVVFAVVAVVIISKNKKKTPRATPQRKTFGVKPPRKRRITPQPIVGVPSSADGPSTYGYFECPNCHEPSAPQGKLRQNPDGSQFCSKCGWRS